MGDGFILPSELQVVLDEVRVFDADDRDFYTRLINAMDLEAMRVRGEQRERERQAARSSRPPRRR